MSFWIPRKEPPKQLPQREMLPFQSPSTISKIPSQRTPLVPQQAPTETPISRSFFYTFPSKSLVNEPHPMFPIRVPMEREASSPETMVYSFIYIGMPNKEPFHEKWGKYLATTHGAPHGRKAYINGVRTYSPRGSFTTLLSLPQCHAAFSTIPSTLAWVDQSSDSQPVS
jgi:hypothetical protein